MPFGPYARYEQVSKSQCCHVFTVQLAMPCQSDIGCAVLLHSCVPHATRFVPVISIDSFWTFADPPPLASLRPSPSIPPHAKAPLRLDDGDGGGGTRAVGAGVCLLHRKFGVPDPARRDAVIKQPVVAAYEFGWVR